MYPASFKLEKKKGDNLSKGKANKQLLFPEFSNNMVSMKVLWLIAFLEETIQF